MAEPRGTKKKEESRGERHFRNRDYSPANGAAGANVSCGFSGWRKKRRNRGEGEKRGAWRGKGGTRFLGNYPLEQTKGKRRGGVQEGLGKEAGLITGFARRDRGCFRRSSWNCLCPVGEGRPRDHLEPFSWTVAGSDVPSDVPSVVQSSSSGAFFSGSTPRFPPGNGEKRVVSFRPLFYCAPL